MAEPSQKTWDVNIQYADVGCEVAPVSFEAKHGDTVRFHNLTNQDVCVQFSKDELFDKDKIKVKTADAADLTVEVELAAAGDRREYHYAVYCKCNDDYAKAGSMPIIIIVRD